MKRVCERTSVKRWRRDQCYSSFVCCSMIKFIERLFWKTILFFLFRRKSFSNIRLFFDTNQIKSIVLQSIIIKRIFFFFFFDNDKIKFQFSNEIEIFFRDGKSSEFECFHRKNGESKRIVFILDHISLIDLNLFIYSRFDVYFHLRIFVLFDLESIEKIQMKFDQWKRDDFQLICSLFLLIVSFNMFNLLF